jgi:hypothetical protein
MRARRGPVEAMLLGSFMIVAMSSCLNAAGLAEELIEPSPGRGHWLVNVGPLW